MSVLVTHVAGQEWNVMHGNETEEEVQRGPRRGGLLSLVGEREVEVLNHVKREAERNVREVMIVIGIHQYDEPVEIGQADINGGQYDNQKY